MFATIICANYPKPSKHGLIPIPAILIGKALNLVLLLEYLGIPISQRQDKILRRFLQLEGRHEWSWRHYESDIPFV